jgi:hypothetical protein
MDISHGLEKFERSEPADFCNNIGQLQTSNTLEIIPRGGMALFRPPFHSPVLDQPGLSHQRLEAPGLAHRLSRSAGNSSARFATRCSNAALRKHFYRETLEEYSHFSDYYHLRHPAINLPDAIIDSYVQLPSSLGFCQQMLRTAESDWLAYVLIAYFQESTVHFASDCREFYHQVETRYDIKGLFDPWMKHIELDIEYCHAHSLESVLDSDERIPIDCVRRSLTAAWFAFPFLVLALDEIVREGRHGGTDIRLRLPLVGKVVYPSENALLTNCKTSVEMCGAGTAFDLYTSMHSLGLVEPSHRIND